MISLIDARTIHDLIHYLSLITLHIRFGAAPSVRKISLIDARIAGAAAHAARAAPSYNRQPRAFAAPATRDGGYTR